MYTHTQTGHGVLLTHTSLCLRARAHAACLDAITRARARARQRYIWIQYFGLRCHRSDFRLTEKLRTHDMNR